ncbi:flagellar hook-associated protein FlgL [Lentisphaerota bacterium WC36G]|nr:flagellar hook-associated protein FlgL [Lentisphaerae bacterium WC36]
MAISSLSYQNSMMNYLGQQQADIYKYNMQITTGKKYVYRSEDPINAMRADTIAKEYELQKQYNDNIESAYNVEQLTNSTLDIMSDNFQRAYELIVQSQSGTQDDSSLETMSKEIDALLDSLIDLGNTTFNGVEIFAGAETGTAPFAIEVDPISGQEVVKFLGEDMDSTNTVENREVQLSENSKMKYGITGDELFVFTAQINTGTTEAPVYVDTEISSLDFLIELRDKLAAGTVPTTQDVEKLQAITIHMSDMKVQSSATLDVLKSRKENFSTIEIAYNDTLSFLQEADQAKVTTELAEVKSSYEATLLLISQMKQMSIINYMN